MDRLAIGTPVKAVRDLLVIVLVQRADCAALPSTLIVLYSLTQNKPFGLSGKLSNLMKSERFTRSTIPVQNTRFLRNTTNERLSSQC